MKFYVNAAKNQVFELVEDNGEFQSAGFELLTPNSTDAAGEKHVPAVTVDGDKVHVVVGEVLHPHTEEHYIGFIVVKTGDLVQRVKLEHTQEPKASFNIGSYKGEVEVFEWCNLHGLWTKTVTV